MTVYNCSNADDGGESARSFPSGRSSSPSFVVKRRFRTSMMFKVQALTSDLISALPAIIYIRSRLGIESIPNVELIWSKVNR